MFEIQTKAGVAGRSALTTGRLTRYGYFVLFAIVVAGVIASAQAITFYRTFTPRVEYANRLLFDLVVESSQQNVYGRVAAGVEALKQAGAAGDQARLEKAWKSFNEGFAAGPAEAIQGLQAVVAVLDTGEARDPVVERLNGDLRRLQGIYTDHYESLLDELEQPPFYLWPTAHFLADLSGYRNAVFLNHALHLAQRGEIGTARVMLTGLRASTEDPRISGLTYYILGRLEFELFRSRPEAEVYTQAVQYLRQSLEADPDSPLAKRFLDYLLSLDQGEAVPRAGEGEPTTPSEGEGAAVPADERRF